MTRTSTAERARGVDREERAEAEAQAEPGDLGKGWGGKRRLSLRLEQSSDFETPSSRNSPEKRSRVSDVLSKGSTSSARTTFLSSSPSLPARGHHLSAPATAGPAAPITTAANSETTASAGGPSNKEGPGAGLKLSGASPPLGHMYSSVAPSSFFQYPRSRPTPTSDSAQERPSTAVSTSYSPSPESSSEHGFAADLEPIPVGEARGDSRGSRGGSIRTPATATSTGASVSTAGSSSISSMGRAPRAMITSPRSLAPTWATAPASAVPGPSDDKDSSPPPPQQASASSSRSSTRPHPYQLSTSAPSRAPSPPNFSLSSGQPLAHPPLKTQAAFVGKLYAMLEDESITGTGLIHWSPDGTVFTCPNPTEFSKAVLPRFFKHNNWQSFVRQLNMYSFNKVNDVFATTSDPQAWEFRHPLFRRGEPHLLASIKRKSTRPNYGLDKDATSPLEDIETPRPVAGWMRDRPPGYRGSSPPAETSNLVYGYNLRTGETVLPRPVAMATTPFDPTRPPNTAPLLRSEDSSRFPPLDTVRPSMPPAESSRHAHRDRPYYPQPNGHSHQPEVLQGRVARLEENVYHLTEMLAQERADSIRMAIDMSMTMVQLANWMGRSQPPPKTHLRAVQDSLSARLTEVRQRRDDLMSWETDRRARSGLSDPWGSRESPQEDSRLTYETLSHSGQSIPAAGPALPPLQQAGPTPRSPPLMSAFPDLTPRGPPMKLPPPPNYPPYPPPPTYPPYGPYPPPPTYPPTYQPPQMGPMGPSSHPQYQPQSRSSDPGKFPFSPKPSMSQPNKGVATPGGSTSNPTTSGGTHADRASPFLPAPRSSSSAPVAVAQIRREGESSRARERPRDMDAHASTERRRDGEDEVMEDGKPSLRNLLN